MKRIIEYIDQKNKQKNNKGFTLVELIVVLVILGIIIALTVPSFMGYLEKQRKEATLNDCKMAVTAAQGIVDDMLTKNQSIAGISADTQIASANTKAKAGEQTYAAAIKEKAELEGTVETVSVGSDDRILHLTYQRYNYDVTYCEKPGSCGDTSHGGDHTDYYTFSKSTASVVTPTTAPTQKPVSTPTATPTLTPTKEPEATASSTPTSTPSNGSVTLTDSNKDTHILKPSMTLEQLLDRFTDNNTNGASWQVNIPNGSIITDGSSTYITCDWTGTYNFPSNPRDMSLESIAKILNQNKTVLLKLESTHKIWIADDQIDFWGSNIWPESSPKKGDICYWKGKYYIVYANIGQWESPPDGNWIEILGN